MKRRDFIKRSLIGIGGASLPAVSFSQNSVYASSTFKLKYAPHEGMFKHHAGNDIISQINFMARRGFTAYEDNELSKKTVAQQKAIGATLNKNKMTMGVFVGHTIFWHKPSLVLGEGLARKQFLSEIKQSIDVAKRVNAKWITVVPGHLDLSLNLNIQTANVVECLRLAAQLVEPHDLVLVIEPLNFRDHPGMFLTTVQQAFEICTAVASPACKILFDVYHQQIQKGDILATMDEVWSEIGYFQVGDNPGRNEPSSGELNYRNIFKHIHEKGYQGVIGMEHGNSVAGRAGEQRVIEAYIASDRF